MKKLFSLILSFALILSLSSCKKKDRTPEEYAGALKTLYSGVSDFDMDACITADYGDYVYSCELDFSGSPDYGRAKITAPENIKGITVTLSDGGSSVEFDGAELYMGKLGDIPSPISSIPAITACWKEGYVSQAAFEKLSGRDALMVTYPVFEKAQLTTWFDLETNFPIKAEISSGGRTVITCSFKDINIR